MIAVALLAPLLLAAAAVQAVSAEAPEAGVTIARRALAIAGPGTVEVGEAARFKVYERATGTPVAGAAVYALPYPMMAVADVAADDVASATTAVPIVAPGARFLGFTNAGGEVAHKFESRGTFAVVALKGGYTSAVTDLKVTPHQLRHLGIAGPSRVEVGETARFKVFDRDGGEPVAGAWVYAFRFPVAVPLSPDAAGAAAELDVESLAAAVAADGAAEELSAEALTRWGGWLIGRTGRDGMVKHAFESPGKYAVVALKRGYTPAAMRVEVTVPPVRELAIAGPGSVRAGDPARFRVTDRDNGEPVAWAAVFAFPANAAFALDALSDELSNADLTARGGQFLGLTNRRGVLTHTFERPGDFYIVAAKRGYGPGVTKLEVTPRITVAPQPIWFSLTPSGLWLEAGLR